MGVYKQLDSLQSDSAQETKKGSKIWLFLLLIIAMIFVSTYFIFTKLSVLDENVKKETFQILDISSTEQGDVKAVIRYQGYPKAVSIKKWVEKEGIENISSLKGFYITLEIADTSRKMKTVDISSEAEIAQNK